MPTDDEHLDDPRVPGPGNREPDQRLGDDVGDRHARIERAERVLEHDLHVAPEPAQLMWTTRRHRSTVERHDTAGGTIETEEDAGERRLS